MIAKLSQPEYLHILLNHLPLTGLAVATVATLVALLLRNRGAIIIGLALMALLAATAWQVIETGEAAYNRIRPLADEDGQRALRQHMDLGEAWVKLHYATAATALLAIGVGWKRSKWLRVASLLAVLLAMASLAAGVFIAEAGGRIRHPEFRSASQPVPPAGETENRQ